MNPYHFAGSVIATLILFIAMAKTPIKCTLCAYFPTNEEVINPRLDTVVWMMRRAYSDAWRYSPTAHLSWRRILDDEEFNRYKLLLIKHPKQGWFVEHIEKKQNGKTLRFSKLSESKSNWIESWSHGDTIYILKGCFVSLTTAIKIVETFVNSGKKSDEIQWESTSKTIPYIYEDPKNVDPTAKVRYI